MATVIGKLDGPQCFLLLLHILNSFDYLGRLLHIHKFEGFPLNSRHRKPQLFLDFLCVLLDIKGSLNIPTCLLPCFIPAKNLCRLVSTQKRVFIDCYFLLGFRHKRLCIHCSIYSLEIRQQACNSGHVFFYQSYAMPNLFDFSMT